MLPIFISVSLKCRGDIALREIVEVSLTAGINVPPKERVKQSEHIRRRHPFFIHGNLKHSKLCLGSVDWVSFLPIERATFPSF